MNAKHEIGEAELRMALHTLRRDIEPERDLWPGIAARLSQQRQAPAPRPRRVWPVALAASMLLALGLAWQGSGPQAVRPVAVGGQPATVPLPKEAEALSTHYQAALRELDVRAAPASWQPGLEALDRSAEQILAALRQSPESAQLLEQLRQIYTRRLALSRRAIFA
jgi:hypothetical protein